jgi:hypothetical protein
MLLRLLLAGALAAGLASAQRGGGGGGMGGDTGMPQAAMRGAPTRLEIMASSLKLRSEQEKQIRNALDAIQKEAAPVRDEMAEKRARIAAAVQAGQPQSEIDASITAYAAVAARMAALEMKAFAGIYQVLDAAQRNNLGPVFNMMSGLFQGKNWNTNQSSPRM